MQMQMLLERQIASWTSVACPASATVVRFLEALLASDTLADFMSAWYCTAENAVEQQRREEAHVAMYYNYMRSSMQLAVQEEAAHLRSLTDTESAESWVEQHLRVLLPAGVWLLLGDTAGRVMGSATRTERVRATNESLAVLPTHLVDMICDGST